MVRIDCVTNPYNDVWAPDTWLCLINQVDNNERIVLATKKVVKMLKVPTIDICIESPKQNEFVNIVSNKNEHILGRGSYGRVYKAVYKDKSAAVKIIEKINDQVSNSVNQESNVLGWSHANIIKIFKVTSLNNCFTIIMERFPGICLQHLLDEMKIPLYHRIRISMDVINGLRFCHSNNLAHLDVKPQNILVAFSESDSVNNSRSDYICKLFDFGCSVLINKNSHSPYHGTIRYMSPDILQGYPVGLHDDIYSFGITMWQLKTNKHPYHNITCNDVVAYHVVKSKLRPDERSKFLETNENTLPSIDINSKIGSGSLCGKCSLIDSNLVSSQKACKLLTPNFQRKPLVAKFLSADHLNKPSTVRNSVLNNVVKKLDFDTFQQSDKNRLSFIARAVNQNLPEVKKKIFIKNEKEICLESEKEEEIFRNYFQDCYINLSEERKIEIENKYTKIYKKCWEQSASKRPSSQNVFNSLSLIFDLFK